MIVVGDYIDKRSKPLWDEILSSGITIRILESPEPNYMCRFDDEQAIIYVSYPPDTASFAHELLHIKLYKNNIRIGSCLYEAIKINQLEKFFTESTKGVIVNCMEHVKMLPQFLEMGYQNSQFITDYDSKKLTIREYYSLCQWYKNDQPAARDRFIGKYCAMRADNNPFHVYFYLYLLLSILDRKLYKIVRAFWNEWERCDVNSNNDEAEGKWVDIINKFVGNISKLVQHLCIEKK